MSLELGQTQRISMELAQLSPSLMIIQDLGGLSPEELEGILEESLEDIRTRDPKMNNSGNYLFTSHFAGKLRIDKGTRFVLQRPKFKARCNEKEVVVERTEDYSKLKGVYTKFKDPNGKPRNPANCFTERLAIELDWIYGKQEEITRYVLMKQQEAITTQDPSKLVRLTQEEVGKKVKLHETTVNRLLKNLAMQVNGHSLLVSDLITPFPEKVYVKRAITEMARQFGSYEDFFQQYSDETIRSMLSARGINLARRTVCKYKQAILASESAKPRTCQEHIIPEQHWYLDRPLLEEDLEAIVKGILSPVDQECLKRRTENWKSAELKQTSKGYELFNPADLPTPNLFFFYMYKRNLFCAEGESTLRAEIEQRAEKTGYSLGDIDPLWKFP